MSPVLVRKILSFGIVGTVGFAVDAGILTLLSSKLGVNVYLARVCSFTVAVFVTWLLNRKWVFRVDGARTMTRTNEYISYLSVQAGGALINLSIFSLIIFYSSNLKAYPIIPLAFGSIGGMIFNFIGAQLWVFRAKQRSELG